MSVLKELTTASKYVSIPWDLMNAVAELVTDSFQTDSPVLVKFLVT